MRDQDRAGAHGRGTSSVSTAQIATAPRWEQVGLTEDEYRRIVELLGREPNDLELGLYGVMWSEHCSYKSSRVHLKRLPTEGARVLVGPGENAGVLDIGDGLAIAVREESHNHPSAIEPYQGAATGVGGILRDIFTMGARPIALLDSLRFGPLEPGPAPRGTLSPVAADGLDSPGTDEARAARNRYLVGGVVKGISDYGNCVGVPTVGGEIYFEECYNENPLVNVMCVGLIPKDKIVRGRAEGVGNPVFLVGAKTGRDGIHGASLLASQEFTAAAEEMRPAVQVGDPFMEKLLIEACLELMQGDAVAGVNDLGAAGLTSSCSETASRAGNGIEIDVALVPRREEGMTPYEVMLSESQERMLVIARQGREAEVEAVFEKWGLEAARIGRVTGDGRLRVLENDRVVADVPARTLADAAPAYDRPQRRPADLDELWAFDFATVPDVGAAGAMMDCVAPGAAVDCGAALRRVLASPNVASRAWAYRQYDHMVRTSTVLVPGAGDASVLRVRGTRKGVALATDGNGRFCRLDPFAGAAMAVAEAARNVACAGARPIGLTNCLNFASPERPEVMWQFRQVIEGMRAACLALDIPVTGGNVSFYNETMGRGVYPTPVIGMVGLLEDLEKRMTPGFKRAGDAVAVLGPLTADPATLAGSEYLRVVHGHVAGRPAIDLELEARLQRVLLAAIEAGLLASAHDCSEGGLAVTLAECCFAAADGARGAVLDLPAPAGPPGAGGSGGFGAAGGGSDWRCDALLFGEAPSRVVVSLPEEKLPALADLARGHGVPIERVGRVGGDRLVVTVNGRALVDESTADLESVWREALPCLMGARP